MIGLGINRSRPKYTTTVAEHPWRAHVRILHVIKSLDHGGAEILIAELSAEQAQRGNEVTIVTCDRNRRSLVDRVDRKVQVEILSNWWIPRLIRRVASSKPNIVHLHSPRTAALARIPLIVTRAARRLQFRLIYTEHNVWPSYHPITRYANRVTWWCNDSAIAVSEAVARSIVGVRNETSVVIHGRSAVSLAKEAESPSPVELLERRGLVIAHVANHRKEKDHFTALKAIRACRDSGLQVLYVSAGEGPLRQAVEAYALELAIDDVCLFLGRVQNAASLIATADIVLLSSIHEGLPVVVMEALMLGRPVLSTSVGGVPELVRDGVNGWLVPPGDPEALASALRYLATHPDHLDRLASSAHESGRRLEISHAADQLEGLYALA